MQVNNELEDEINRLRAALDTSIRRLDALKGLASSVSSIRGSGRITASELSFSRQGSLSVARETVAAT